MRRLCLALCLVLAASAAPALTPAEMLDDPALEARARSLSRELRCMVCQNQSIDDSDAPLARDLRVLVRERLAAGDSDQQVKDFLVARYGTFVLLRPPVTWRTALLWAAPVLLAGGGLVALLVSLRRRRRGAPEEIAAEPPLTAQERAKVSQVLRGPEA